MAVRPYTFIELCAGVGGLGLGVRIAEPCSRCIAYIEREAYAASILVARMAQGWLDQGPVWSDLATFDAGAWRGAVDCVVSGDPCQPNSIAGSHLGHEDDRFLIEQAVRVFDQCGAARFFRENVTGNLEGQLAALVPLLERLGCRVAAGIFSASEAGASHRRERLFIMADRNMDDSLRRRLDANEGRSLRTGWNLADDAGRAAGAGDGDNMVDTYRARSQGWNDHAGEHADQWHPRQAGAGLPLFAPGPRDTSWPDIIERAQALEPAVRRVADGSAFRVDRLRACGNACVPLAAAYAWRALDALLDEDRAPASTAAVMEAA